MNALHTLILKLASKSSGTNCRELMKHTEMSTQCASDALTWRVEKYGLILVKGKSTEAGHVSHQYFALSEHARAWEAMLPSIRPNVAIRQTNPKRSRPLRPIQSATWARAPMTGNPHSKRPVVIPVHGIALGYDERYQLGPDEAKAFRGPFGSLPIGKYPE